MVFLDLAGLQLSAGSGGEAGKTSGDVQQAVKEVHYKHLVQSVPMHTSIHSAVELRNRSEVSQGTLLF